MKFELVEFYPLTEKNRGNINKKYLGSIHIYAHCDECQIDFRGINVIQQGKSIYFNMPHKASLDHETGEKVVFPFFRWTSEKLHKEMMDFLHKEVKPKIKDLLSTKSKK